MRLTPDEVEIARQRLSHWQSPAEMHRTTEQLMDHLGSEDLFNQSGLTFILEAWAAAEFAQKRGATSLHLIQTERPDCELKFADGVIEPFEIVEADIKRRRGLEYQVWATSGKARDWPLEEWATAEQAREVIRGAAEKKANKARDLASAGTPYPAGTSLLIYLNISDFGANHEAIKREFAASVAAATSSFPSIWILWKGVAYHVFSRGT